MEAIVLVGGLGNRLRSVVSDVPKPMAPVNGKPFLHFLLARLSDQGISHVILATGYMHEKVESYFGKAYLGLALSYSVEKEALGTGGAIRQAEELCHDSEYFVFNGDSFFEADLKKMLSFHQQKKADITLGLKRLQNFDRYGSVKTDDDGRVHAFEEKTFVAEGAINAGVYLLKKNILAKKFPRGKSFSLENDFLAQEISQLPAYGFKSDGFFIDIGIPEDFQRAQDLFKNSKPH